MTKATERWAAALAGMVLAVMAMFVWNYLTTNSVETDVGRISWFNGAPPWEVVVTVRDKKGDPLGGVEVHVVNTSGGSSRTSDANGIVEFPQGELGEDEVMEVKVDGKPLMFRHHLQGMFAPSIRSSGLFVHVIMK